MGNVIHETTPVQVWVNVDVGIADLVRYLNTIPGVRTTASCQGTLGEGGPHPYPAHVDVTWDSPETLARLQAEFDTAIEGVAWGTVFREPRTPEQIAAWQKARESEAER